MFGHTMQSVKDPDKALAEQLLFQDAELRLLAGPYGRMGDELAKITTGGGSAAYISDNVEYPSNDPAVRLAIAKQRGAAADVLMAARSGNPVFTVQNNTGGNASVQLNQSAASFSYGAYASSFPGIPPVNGG